MSTPNRRMTGGTQSNFGILPLASALAVSSAYVSLSASPSLHAISPEAETIRISADGCTMVYKFQNSVIAPVTLEDNDGVVLKGSQLDIGLPNTKGTEKVTGIHMIGVSPGQVWLHQY